MTETDTPKPKAKKGEDHELFKLKPAMAVPFKGFPLTEWPSARHSGATCTRLGEFWRVATKEGDMYCDIPAAQAVAVYRASKRK